MEGGAAHALDFAGGALMAALSVATITTIADAGGAKGGQPADLAQHIAGLVNPPRIPGTLSPRWTVEVTA